LALVIGNGAYVHVKALPFHPTMRVPSPRRLRDIGLIVSEGVDLDRAAMQKMTREFLHDAARAQVALVCYAGHGVQVNGREHYQVSRLPNDREPCDRWPRQDVLPENHGLR
jgi:uncharacterized caspase-like protein